MKIIAFGHRQRVGKDTAAGFLQNYLNQQPRFLAARTSFAKRLKDITYDMYYWAGLMPGEWYDAQENQKYKDMVLPQLGKTPRDLWIHLGESVRQISPNVWPELVAASVNKNATFCIVSDLRHWSELDYVIYSEGYDIKIVNPRVPESADPVDSALADYQNWAGTIVNDGTLSELEAKVVLAGRAILAGERGWTVK